MKPNIRSEERFAVIMAGGRGERFWPLSREKMPKQLLTLLGQRSLLQQTVDRILPVVPLPNIYVITTRAQLKELRRQLPQLPRENVVAEPVGRDTCAAVVLGAALVGARSTRGVMAVLPSDHVISEGPRYLRVLRDCFDLAARGQVIVTIGIEPSEPATSYGYIRVGEPLPPPSGSRRYRTMFHRAERFVEKPGLEQAQDYVNSGRYRWNAGMFIWGFTTITEGLQRHRPEMHEACQRWFTAAADTAQLSRVLARDYPKLPMVSIDYAIMEHARNVVVADGDFGWDDLGSWNALARHLNADGEGNVAMGELIHVDAARNIVVDARVKGRTPIALVGQRDTIIVLADDAVLVVPKSESQKLKQLVKKLGETKQLRRLT